jgi:hypothetical protein
MQIKWKMFIMNHAYGIKKFVLNEEAELPSVGYSDIVTVIEYCVLICYIYSICLIDTVRTTCPSLREGKNSRSRAWLKSRRESWIH